MSYFCILKKLACAIYVAVVRGIHEAAKQNPTSRQTIVKLIKKTDAHHHYPSKSHNFIYDTIFQTHTDIQTFLKNTVYIHKCYVPKQLKHEKRANPDDVKKLK